MKTNLEPLVVIFPSKLVLIQISVVLQLVMNTCGLEDISKPSIHDYEFIKKQA